MLPDISFVDLNAIFELIADGFWAGALIGLVIGAITWTVTERGSTIVFILSIAFLIGLIIGIYMEGEAFLNLMASDRDVILESSDPVRRTVFSSLVGIIQWIFAFLALGSVVASSRRAVQGGVLGVIVGTICGMILILFSDNFAFSVDNPLANVLIGLASMLLLTVMALNQSES